MEYKEFFDRLAERSLPRCLLLHGEEEYIKEMAVRRLRAALLPEGLEVMNEAVFTGAAEEGAILEACEQLPFMGEHRLVLVRDHPLLLGGNGGGDGARLTAYLPSIPEQTTLAFVVRGNADARKRLPAAIGKLGGIVLMRAMQERELYAFLRREAKRAGKGIDAQAVERLVFLCGTDLTVLTRELEKAVAHAGEREAVAVVDVEAVAVPTLEANVFAMIDALLEGRKAQGQALYRALLRDGESPIRLLAILINNLRQLRHARVLLAAKHPRAEIERAVGVSGYVAGRVLRRAEQMDEGWLAQRQADCERVDYEIKSGQSREDIALDGVMLGLLTRRGGDTSPPRTSPDEGKFPPFGRKPPDGDLFRGG